MAEPAKGLGGYGAVLERLKEKIKAEGRWIEEEAPKEQPGPDPLIKLSKNDKKKGETDREKEARKSHKGFAPGQSKESLSLWLYTVYDYIWRRAKKTRTGKLRWEGYIRDIATGLSRSYAQTRRDVRVLEGKGVFHRWNTGKRFPKNITSGIDPKYHFTVLTLVWNPNDLKRQKILAKKELSKRRKESKECMNSSTPKSMVDKSGSTFQPTGGQSRKP